MLAIDERLKIGESAYQRFTPTEYQKQVMLCFPEDEKHFGYLCSATGHALLPLLTRHRVDIEPLALKCELRDIIHRASKSTDARVKVDINIYGTRTDSSTIGNILSEGKLWLQRSSHGRSGTEYENPHFLSITIEDGTTGVLNPEIIVNNEQPKKKTREDQLRKMVEEVYKTVENNRELEMVEGGDRVTRQLLR
jgi:hypothetical protein